MKDNEYYNPIDAKKSVSDEKQTLEDQATTILKKKFDFRLKNKNKKKKNSLNQSTALVMSSVAVVMVTTAAFPTTPEPSQGSLIYQGEWESDTGIYLYIDSDGDMTFSSDNVPYDFTITSNTITSISDVELHGKTNFDEEYGEIMANYVIEYGDSQINSQEGDIDITVTVVDEETRLLVDFKVISKEPIYFTKRVSDSNNFTPEFQGELWLSETSNKQIIFDFILSKILYFDGVDDGMLLSQNVIFNTNEVTAHIEVYEYRLETGNMYRNSAIDHYFTGTYMDNNSEMQVEIIFHGELIVDNEIFYKSDILYDDDYWSEVYNIIFPEENAEYTPPTPTQTPEPETQFESTVKTFVWYSDESEFNNRYANVTYSEDNNQIMLHSESGVWRNGYIFTDPGSSIAGENAIIFIDPSAGQSADTTSVFITETDFGFNLQVISDDGEPLGSFDFILVE